MAEGFVLVTGATGGLGRKTVDELVRRGVPVVVGGRRRQAVEAVVADVRARGGSALPFVADLAELASVRHGLRTLDDVRLRAVVANAGLSTQRDARTEDGFELTFGVNVLAHQLVLWSLRDHLVDGARVVVLSSGVHEPDNRLARRSGVPAPTWLGTRHLALPDVAPESRRIAVGAVRYSTSKLGNALQARAFQEHLRAAGRDVDVFALDPGLMVDTGLGRELPRWLVPVVRAVGYAATPFVANMRLSSTTARAVASLVLDERWHGRGFLYLDGLRPKAPSADAQRDDLRDELWQQGADLVGIAVPPLP
ncbi:SDR family NAD(P)-dependent oxidoreductase [Actinotalea subterranea]|uniref:SDR family NAD(P)-dependent oxidoreductase n=1 Tax=Actinotalea subterranea TaxID=2607497 RepID=UPI0011EFEEED|nr:SDR family NAD(P)-dependent oxidoreductase [Actinotalea subterranea]